MGEKYFMRIILALIRWRGWINMILIRQKNTTIFRYIFPITFSMILINLTGCTTCANAIPNNEPTMAEIYENSMQQSHQSTLEQARDQVRNAGLGNNSKRFVSHDMRSTQMETDAINNAFPILPNPQLVMYIYPHLSRQDEAPIPGYTTAFSLYEKTYYAMEGELNLRSLGNG